MRVDDWLKSNVILLQKAGIETARLDCLVLLEDASHKDRAWLLAHGEYELEANVLATLHNKIIRRSAHVPLAYIRRHVEFYGREFAVNEHVLVPRPDSEAMIDLLKDTAAVRNEDLKHIIIIDVGTGSGALAITAKLEVPRAEVIGVDIDAACLNIADKNAKKLGANVVFMQSNLLDSMNAAADIILANLPYVPDEYPINKAAGHEPGLAPALVCLAARALPT